MYSIIYPQEELKQYKTLNICISNDQQIPPKISVGTLSDWIIQAYNDVNNLIKNDGLSNQRNKDIAYAICYILEKKWLVK